MGQPTGSELNGLAGLYAQGDFVALETEAGRLLASYPDAGFLWQVLGVALNSQGKDGLLALQRAVALLPGDAPAHSNLGNALKDAGRLPEAEASYRHALALNAEDAVACYNLGCVLQEQDKLDEAMSAYRETSRMQPDFVPAHYNLATLLDDIGDVEGAEACYRKVLDLQPGHVQANYNLGWLFHHGHRFAEAEKYYRQVLALQPAYVDALHNLGLVLNAQGFSAEAEHLCLRALACEPGNARVRAALGAARLERGSYVEAEADFRSALEIDPTFSSALGNILFLHTLDGRHGDRQCLDDARHFGRLVSAQATGRFSQWQCEMEPERLRVGVVSGDIRDHSVGLFLEGFLKEIDPSRVELIAYPTHRETNDLTTRVKPCFAKWSSLVSLPDDVAAKRIHDDGIHVLLDLSGHMAYNRLPVFAWKPAPVQASWLGYCATTGVAEMDYYIADAETLPEDQEKNFVEKIWRLPDSYLCFSQPVFEVAVVPPPVLTKGHITFGSFNNLAKMTDEVIAAWSRILDAVPGSRLLLKSKQLKEPGIRTSVLARYAAHGIGAERLILENPIGNRGGHLAAYGLVDIGLDTFPYNGVTTTMEALWMGVPVLTLAGDRFLARQGVGILTHAGLSDWIAAETDELVAKAIAFSQDQTRLSELRAGLRERILSSPLLDARRFARNFEDALWGMWKKYKEAKGAAGGTTDRH